MIKYYNYIIYIISLLLTKLFIYKKVGIYNLFIKLSFGNFKYSIYGVKLSNKNKKDNTYRYCIGGAYGNNYADYLKFYKSNFIFLDIGSNIGLYSCIASRNKNCKYIYSFEPVKKLCNEIYKNFKLNGVKGKVLKLGISKKNGLQNIYFRPEHTGMSSLIKKKNKDFSKILKCRFVNSKGLNKIIKNKTRNYLVKIDVEGLEKIVLKELAKTKFFKFVNSLLIEINNSNDIEKINKMLKKKNFYLFKDFKSNLTNDYLFIKNEI